MNTEAYEQHFCERVEQVIGPTRPERQPRMADARWLAGLYRLQPIWLGLVYGHGRLIGYYVSVSLKERPIDCSISRRRRAEDAQLPRVLTGSHNFDQQFLVNGKPPEVVRGVLNSETRRWMMMIFNEMAPQFDTRDGQLRLYTALLQGRDPLRAQAKPLPTLQELSRRIEVTLALADRMISAYDANFATELEKQRSKIKEVEERRARRKKEKRRAKRERKRAELTRRMYVRGLLIAAVLGALAAVLYRLLT